MRDIVPIFWPIAHKVNSPTLLINNSTAPENRTDTPLCLIVCQLRTAIHSQLASHEPTEIDVLAWLSRAALELIGQAGLGYSFDDLDPKVTTPNDYSRAVKELTFVPDLHVCR